MEIIVEKLSKGIAIKVEKYIKLYLQPKPKWLPNFIWQKILSRLLVLKYLERRNNG